MEHNNTNTDNGKMNNHESLNKPSLDSEAITLSIVSVYGGEGEKIKSDELMVGLHWFVCDELQNNGVEIETDPFKDNGSGLYKLPYSESYLDMLRNDLANEDNNLINTTILRTFGGDERIYYSSGENIESAIDTYFSNSQYEKDEIMDEIELMLELLIGLPISNSLSIISDYYQK